jgi:hypothetical protein
MLFDLPEPPDPTESAKSDVRCPKTSRAAEYIAALYIALLVCTPWLVRDASFFRPPSTGVEMHWNATAPVYDASAHPAQAIR